ncbi:Hypothetical predicted protein [Olea europaea subsp. europaea]|uniref:5'-3' DNA helicase ZGRF1-like N-terminal domain-containing protein n=1 Tax=Olea europaea subsp. europaea TaxID=158383 RepID=A0A8S0S2P8_OLEEU|nr:Hypothetical predicted protein [Olea europaea subsp. europaea]
MEDRKRWSVTYTKHVKQKRKVYQDGFLELHSSARKVMLYDECEKLLESRFVNKDDVIESGETLAFASHLVDIGDLYGDHKPVSGLSFQRKDEKVLEKLGSLHNNKFGHNSNSVDMKTTCAKKKARVTNLSPSQKIIRDYKKRETNKYCFSPSCSDSMKSGITEWEVLYTAQIHQKAKKFHDGFLKLVVHGTQGRQVMLYDTTRRLLDNRFLKRDEIVSSGELLVFDCHLVDIGELQKDNKPTKDLALQGINCNAVVKTETTYNKANPTNGKFHAGKCMVLNDRSSKIDDAKLSWTVSANKPRRAAHEILSNLRKSTTEENIVAVKRALVEEIDESKSSVVVHSNIKDQLQEQACGCNGSVLKELNRKTILVHDCSAENFKSEAVNEVLPIGAEKVEDHDKRGESQTRTARSYLRSETTNHLTSILSLEGTDFIESTSVSSAVESQELVALVLDIEGQTPTGSMPPSTSNKNLEIESHPQVISQEATPGLCSSQQPTLCEDNQVTAARCCEGASQVGTVASNGRIADDISDIVQSKQDFNTTEMDDFPSFDLGI